MGVQFPHSAPFNGKVDEMGIDVMQETIHDTRCLLIGGQEDGKIQWADALRSSPPPLLERYYLLCRWGCYAVFYHADLTETEAWRKLLSQYDPEKVGDYAQPDPPPTKSPKIFSECFTIPQFEELLVSMVRNLSSGWVVGPRIVQDPGFGPTYQIDCGAGVSFLVQYGEPFATREDFYKEMLHRYRTAEDRAIDRWERQRNATPTPYSRQFTHEQFADELYEMVHGIVPAIPTVDALLQKSPSDPIVYEIDCGGGIVFLAHYNANHATREDWCQVLKLRYWEALADVAKMNVMELRKKDQSGDPTAKAPTR